MTAITITDAAHDYLADLLSKQNTPGIGIRVFITQPGTQYAETCIAYCKPGEEKPEDTALGLKASPRISITSVKPSSTTRWSTTPPTAWAAS